VVVTADVDAFPARRVDVLRAPLEALATAGRQPFLDYTDEAILRNVLARAPRCRANRGLTTPRSDKSRGDESATPGELVPRRPATQARLEAVLAEEAKLDPALLDAAVAAREVLELRSRAKYQSWHWPGAPQLDFQKAIEACPSFARDRSYALYCEYGLEGAHLAELMRRRDLRACHVRGGTATLRKLAASREGDAPAG
jgi:rhodanese-related sulfurtransferase